MIIQVVGKQTFYSPKKSQDYYVLHTLFKRDGVDGHAVETKFVSSDLFGKVSIGKQYVIVYDAYANGRAFISDLREVNSGNG